MGSAYHESVRFFIAAVRTFHPFSLPWMLLFAVAVFLTFGLGGGTPTSAMWLVIKFGLLALLLASLVVELALMVWRLLRRSDVSVSDI